MAQSVARTRFLTVAEVAQSLRVSTMTVYRLMKAGRARRHRVGKSYRISESDLDHYLASVTRKLADGRGEPGLGRLPTLRIGPMVPGGHHRPVSRLACPRH